MRTRVHLDGESDASTLCGDDYAGDARSICRDEAGPRLPQRLTAAGGRLNPCLIQFDDGAKVVTNR